MDSTTLYYYSDKWQLLSEYVDDAFDKNFVYGNYIDEVLVLDDGSNDYFYLHDHLYSSVALLSSAGSVVERYEYDAYGKVHIMDSSYNPRTSSSYDNPYYFTGRRLSVFDNGGLKIYHFRHRDMNLYMGVFYQQDPLGYVDGMNPYLYVGANPLLYSDAYGLKWGDGTWWDPVVYFDMYIGYWQGLGQGVLNTANGVQDAVVGVLNTPVAIYNYGIWSQKQSSRLRAFLLPDYFSYDAYEWDSYYSPYIPSWDWSKDKWVREGDFAHGSSKFLGGNGLIMLITLGISNGGQCGSLVDDVGNLTDEGAQVVRNILDDYIDDAGNLTDDGIKLLDDFSDNIRRINGNRPYNYKYAGNTHPSGVQFTSQGFPDFSPYAIKTVKLPGSLSGNYQIDAALANKVAGYAKTPSGYVWHHVEDAVTMQLVPQNIHSLNHTGGSAVIRWINIILGIE